MTNTRPDISFTVQQLSHYLDKPRESHLVAAHRILRYLKGKPTLGIFYPANSDMKLKTYTDFDWGTCPDTRKSVTGYCVFLGNPLISWKAKKQNIVSRSSSKAEYRAMASTAAEIQWLLNLLKDFKIKHKDPALLFCDKLPAVHIAKNPTFHERTKHLDIDCHFNRRMVQAGKIHLMSVSSANQLADMLTKTLHSPAFANQVARLGLISIQ